MKFSSIFPKILIFCCFVLSISIVTNGQTKDDTIIPFTKGSDVVQAVIYQLTLSSVLVDDNSFLRRVAYVESVFGNDPNTYRDGYFGGIWQVDEAAFRKTKDVSHFPNLVDQHEKIKQTFNIDWEGSVEWKDLLKPLYSGLAATLLISTFPLKIPQSIGAQGQHWKTFYDTPAGSGTITEYVYKVKELESKTACRARINLVAVLDGSSSIGSHNFPVAKTAVGELLSRFNLDRTQIGLIVFSNSPTTIFPIQQFNSAETIKTNTNAAEYPRGGTSTHLGIDLASQMLQENTNKLDPSAPVHVMIVITDGRSNYPPLTIDAANRAIALGITSFAVGIGNIYEPELLAIAGNNQDRVFTIDDFETLIELVYSLNQGACEVSVKPLLDETVEDEVLPNEKRYFNYPFDSVDGIKIHLEQITGRTSGYFSYTYATPSAAFHDGVISGEFAYIKAPDNEASKSSQVFIAIEGLENSTNQFHIGAEEDRTLAQKGKGKEMIDAVILKVGAPNIFSDDKRFFTRVAYVESKFGDDSKTYREGYFGGIWQVNETAFLDTKNVQAHPDLPAKYEAIKYNFGIDWNTVKWEDLWKPFHSALAARLFVLNLPEEIPDLMDSQAQYWKTYYDTPSGDGTVQQFIDAINELENTTITHSKP